MLTPREQDIVGGGQLGKVGVKLGAAYQEVKTQYAMKLARDEFPCEAHSGVPSLLYLSYHPPTVFANGSFSCLSG